MDQVLRHPMSSLSLSLKNKRRLSFLDETMPKKKKALDNQKKRCSEPISKRQTQLDDYFISPKKNKENNFQSSVSSLTPLKSHDTAQSVPESPDLFKRNKIQISSSQLDNVKPEVIVIDESNDSLILGNNLILPSDKSYSSSQDLSESSTVISEASMTMFEETLDDTFTRNFNSKSTGVTLTKKRTSLIRKRKNCSVMSDRASSTSSDATNTLTADTHEIVSNSKIWISENILSTPSVSGITQPEAVSKNAISSTKVVCSKKLSTSSQLKNNVTVSTNPIVSDPTKNTSDMSNNLTISPNKYVHQNLISTPTKISIDPLNNIVSTPTKVFSQTMFSTPSKKNSLGVIATNKAHKSPTSDCFVSRNKKKTTTKKKTPNISALTKNMLPKSNNGVFMTPSSAESTPRSKTLTSTPTNAVPQNGLSTTPIKNNSQFVSAAAEIQHSPSKNSTPKTCKALDKNLLSTPTIISPQNLPGSAKAVLKNVSPSKTESNSLNNITMTSSETLGNNVASTSTKAVPHIEISVPQLVSISKGLVSITPVHSSVSQEGGNSPLCMTSTPPKFSSKTKVNTPEKKAVTYIENSSGKKKNEINTGECSRSLFLSPDPPENSQTSMEISPVGSEGGTVRFSPKIKRRPGKYFSKETMPQVLSKSPVKKAAPKKKSLTPRKRNLMKDFDQAVLDSYLPPNYNNMLNDEMLAFNNLTDNILESDTNTSNMDEVEGCIGQINEPVKEIFERVPSNISEVEISSVSPSKRSKINFNKSENVIDYILGNPMMDAAKRQWLSSGPAMDQLKTFRDMPSPCQILFAKLFERTPVWYRVDTDLDKNYKNSLGDVKGHISTLVQHGLITNDVKSIDLQESLNLLNVNEIKAICKHFNVCTCLDNMKKENLIKALMLHSTSQRVLTGNLSDKIKAKVVNTLGQCVRMRQEYKDLFNMLVVLATYPYYMDEEKKRLSDLTNRLNLLSKRLVSYPAYVFRQDVAFRHLNHLAEYADALSFVGEYSVLVENKNWDEAGIKVQDGLIRFKSFMNSDNNQELMEDLGGHLLKFTAGYQYAYCLHSGINVLKKIPKLMKETIEVVNALLSQTKFLQRKRGLWYDELALIHTKNKNLLEACEAVKTGLEDSKVDDIKKRMLSQRALTLVKRKSSVVPDGLRAQLRALSLSSCFKPSCDFIVAKSHEGVAGRKQVFYKESEDGKEYSSVEEIVIDHYCKTATPSYAYGVHDEGRYLMNIVLACFYNVIYHNPEGDSMFHCHMQTHPLDWGGHHFYKRRQQLIHETLDKLRMGGLSEIMANLNNLCITSENESSILNWDYLRPAKLGKIQELLDCLGVEVFLKIAEHVIKDYKTYHSGFPDLILWNPPTKDCLIVEVKGPNDKLSPSQTVWLENLTKFGAQAKVCHVENIGTTKRKTR